MKKFTLFIVISSCAILSSLAQITMESLDLKAPEVTSKGMSPFSQSGPLVIVKIGFYEYELEDLSRSKLDVNWIQGISVMKDKKATEKYGSKGNKGVILVKLKKDLDGIAIKLHEGRIVEFIEIFDGVESPYEIKMLD